MKKFALLLLFILSLGMAGGAWAANLLNNPTLDAYSNSPNPVYWSGINSQYHGSDTKVYRTSPNSWKFSGNGWIYQDIAAGFTAGHVCHFSAYFYMRGSTALTGSRSGVAQIECYDTNGSLLGYSRALPNFDRSRGVEASTFSEAYYLIPANTTKIRFLVYMNNWAMGSGSFYVDDVVAEDFTCTPTATPTNTPTQTSTITATATNVGSQTATQTASVTPSFTKTPTTTPTNTPTNSPTPTNTATITPTPTNTPVDFYIH